MWSSEYSTLWGPPTSRIRSTPWRCLTTGLQRVPPDCGRSRSSRVMCHLPAQGRMVWWTCRFMAILCVVAGADPSADTACRTRRSGSRRRSLGASRLGRRFPAGSQTTAPLGYRWQDGVRRALPIVCSSLRPLAATGPDRTCLRRGAHHSAGKAAPGKDTGGSHGQSSRFPAVVPTRNIADPQTVKYSTGNVPSVAGRQGLCRLHPMSHTRSARSADVPRRSNGVDPKRGPRYSVGMPGHVSAVRVAVGEVQARSD